MTPSDPDPTLEARLAGLRAAFDAGFAAPPPEPAAATVPLLLVRGGAASLALRLDELAWLEPAPPLTRLPGGAPGLLGLTIVLGRLVAVFDLGALTGSGGRTGTGTHVVLVRGADDVALNVTAVEGRAALELAALPPEDEVVTTIAIEGAPRGLVSMAALVRGLRARGEGDA